MKKNNSLSPTVIALRDRHPRLRYRGYSAQRNAGGLEIEYDFLLEPDIHFTPRITVPTTRDITTANAERLIFLIGMVELISYWKLSCPQVVSVECGYLDSKELLWWEQLFRNGLGEYFYLNEISPRIDFSFMVSSPPSIPPQPPKQLKKVESDCLVLVGGGKDSIVSLELIQRFFKDTNRRIGALCVNPIPASLDAIATAGIANPLIVRREIDPRLRTMNSEGYLNGHTPYSALLAFVSALTAEENNFYFTIASNETSASEGNASIEGIEVNHQYSKSYHFEKVFREYLQTQNINTSYFSFLRPINELQICALFSDLSQYHAIFRSCNREQTTKARQTYGQLRANTEKREGWCGECPKCVFTYLCLVCFLPLTEVDAIFGVSPLTSSDFPTIATDLAGAGSHKPFECVGTYAEVQSALMVLIEKVSLEQPQHVRTVTPIANILPASPLPVRAVLTAWDSNHFLPAPFEALLRNALHRKEQP